MALSNAEKERRRNDPRIKDITERICRYDSGKPYVFISYKSDDWERVLGDIVHKLVMDFGLNVYFDGDFNGHNPLWTEQFPENMEAENCKGIIVFVDDAYTTSYATLMELLYSQVGCQQNKPPYETIPKPVVTINLGTLTVIYDQSDTGLGTKSYEDGGANIHWKDEKGLFDELFRKAAKSEIISNTVKPYKKANGKLNKELCSAMFREVLAYIRVNDNFIGEGITLEDIVHTIESAFGKDVFGKSNSAFDDKSKNKKKSIKDGENDRKTSDKDESDKVSDGGRDIYTPNPALDTIKIISDGLIFHKRGKDGSYDAFYRKDGDKYVVLAGSKLRYNEKWTPKKIWEQYKEEITNEGILLCDINNLPISTAAKLIEGTSTSGKELDTNDSLMAEGESYEVSYDSSKIAADTGIIINPEKDDPEDVSEFILNGEEGARKSSRSVVSNPIIKKTNGFEYTLEELGGKTVPSKKKSEFADGYNYHIYGIEYHAGRREQANLMYDTFNAIINKHPDKVEDIVANCTSVSKKSDILDFGTRNAMPPYFRMCKEFTVNGEVYVVGSSYDFENKIAQIYRMIDACGEDRSIFELEGFEQKKKRDKIDNGKVPKEEQFTGFEYTLWGISHTSNKMSDMMNDVFDLIAERYPDRIEDIAEDDTITAVARKEDIDEGKIQGSKTANQFAHFNKREHSLNGQIYYVNAGYNREGGIRQLCKMLIICDGNADGLKITKMPEKSSHSGGNTRKKGLGELL